MPEAGWCSACARYVWLAPDGRCQNGHGAEFISGHFIDPAPDPRSSDRTSGPPAPYAPPLTAAEPEADEPRPDVRPRVLVIGVILLALIGGLTATAWVSLSSILQTTSRAELPAEPDQPEPWVFTPMTEGDWNRFVNEQYPGYRVERLIKVPNQWGTGLLGRNYVLVNESRPKFTLVVTLTQPPLDENHLVAPDGFIDVVDGVATNDDLFSVSAMESSGFLADQGQNAIIDGYLVNKPHPSAVVFDGLCGTDDVSFSVATGSDAPARAIRGGGDWDYLGESPLPSGPRNATVMVTVAP